MPWLYLSLAIVTEVTGTISLKLSNGFSSLPASIVVFVAYGTSFFLLGLSLKGIELSVAYAIWAGVGTGLIAIAGLAVFGEQFTLLKAVSIVFIITGVVGLNLSKAAS